MTSVMASNCISDDSFKTREKMRFASYRDGLNDYVGILMIKSANDGSQAILGPIGAPLNPVAEVHDLAPIF